ncbi:MAG: hypothetical protein M0R37_15495 [Bacteroidales bacterium]|jgi:hypothetical protein|nr:hypothetical protein [Sphaerochaeta sp.]MCK9629981.1 hypothetical protein [Bacteroidales bacterium]
MRHEATNSLKTGKAFFTPEGGLTIKLTNKTGAPSVKGYMVHANSGQDNSFVLGLVDEPDPIGFVYENGVADGSECLVVVSGIAQVYFIGNTTRGQFARWFLSADGASYVAGQCIAEALPASPFSDAKHFYEVGHVLESRTGAGLAKCVIHFN